MSPLLRIAFRNVVRHKRRTIITGVVMMAGIGLYIAFDSMLAGMDRLTIDTMVESSSSAVKVRSQAYADNQSGTPLDYGLADPEALSRAALASGATAVTFRTAFIGELSNYADALPVQAYAVDPASDARVFSLASSLKPGGRWLSAEPSAGREIVLGSELAGELGVGLGQPVLLSARTRLGSQNADEFTVVGLLDAADPAVNRNGAYLSFSQADALIALDKAMDAQGGETPAPRLYTEMDTALARAPSLDAQLKGAEALAARIRAAVPGYSVESIGTMAGDYLALRNTKSKFVTIIILVVLLIAAVGIVNTVLMSVYSRIREIGVLRAYGMKPKDIRRLFTLEGLILGIFGAAAGVLFGAGLDWLLVTVGIPVGKLVSGIDLGDIPLQGSMYGQWNPAQMAFGFIFGVAVSFIAAGIPARRASRIQVTDALRFI